MIRGGGDKSASQGNQGDPKQLREVKAQTFFNVHTAATNVLVLQLVS